MAVVELVGDLRRRMGKGGSRQVRRDGFVPAVIYGGDGEPNTIKIERRKFEVLLRTPGGMHSVIDFELPGGRELALIREVQRHPVSRQVVHVDFQRIKEGVKVQVTLPIIVTGTPVGVKMGGGILENITREIVVEALPRDILGRFEVDVSNLDVGDALHVRDLELPNLETVTEGDRVIAVVVSPSVAEETTSDEEGEDAEGGEAAPAEEPSGE